VSAAPYPSEIRIVPQRRRLPWPVLALAAVALALIVITWPRSHPAPAAVPRHPAALVPAPPAAHPAKPLSITVGRTAYSCAVVPARAKH
jgi:hypothetical protein